MKQNEENMQTTQTYKPMELIDGDQPEVWNRIKAAFTIVCAIAWVAIPLGSMALSWFTS